MYCLIAILFDGYDMNVFGVVVPVLMKDLSLNPTQIGLLASWGLAGMVIGAIIFGTFADKIGRKKTIILGIVTYCVFTASVGLAKDMTTIATLRFMAGLGLAGVMPNLVALVTEFSPRTHRGTLAALLFLGIPLGNITAAGLGMLLLEKYGWPLMFFVAALPLLLVPFYYRYLPESMVFLIKQGKNEEIRGILSRANPDYTLLPDDTFEIDRQEKGKGSISNLFKDGYRSNTILFWIANFMSLFMLFAIGTWLPKLMTTQGYPLGSSLWFLLTFNLGALLGIPLGGRGADKFGYKFVLGFLFTLAAVLISMISIKSTIIILSILIFFAGASVFGIQAVLNSYVAQSYPLNFRSTGAGWALGIGRLGAVLGPTIGGLMLSFHLSITLNFIAFAIPGIFGALAIMLTRDKVSSLPRESQDVLSAH
ncbi:MAG: MFS transporter [Desulfitobacterium sp.]